MPQTKPRQYTNAKYAAVADDVEEKTIVVPTQLTAAASVLENNDGRMSPTDIRLVSKEQATEIRTVQASAEFQAASYDIATGEHNSNDVRIAVIGNVDSGKSTMVGVMTKSIMDDGRGSARQKVFNFSHEAANGRTSSIGQEIMGFDAQNNQVLEAHQNASKNQSWAHVAQNSQRLVTFLDLCGHEKYLKTTMFGLVGLMPDYSMIVVGANMGVSKMTREHLGISLALGVPLFIVITKIDLAPEEKYQETLATLTKILQSPQAGKNPFAIPRGALSDDTDVSLYAKAMPGKQICPIFSVSNVNGDGIPCLKKFMSLLTSRVRCSGQFGLKTDPVEFLIDGFY